MERSIALQHHNKHSTGYWSGFVVKAGWHAYYVIVPVTLKEAIALLVVDDVVDAAVVAAEEAMVETSTIWGGVLVLVLSAIF